jgi:hypothetical protein
LAPNADRGFSSGDSGTASIASSDVQQCVGYDVKASLPAARTVGGNRQVSQVSL